MSKFNPFPPQSQGDHMRNINWWDLVADGENPRGFQARTANGTAGALGHTGYNFQYDWERMPAPEEGVRGVAEIEFKGIRVKGGRANRSGE